MEFIEAKTIVSNYSGNNRWFDINYNMNIYKGCCHGCIYCDSRSDCYDIQDFDSVRAKADSTRIIERELKSKQKKGVVGTGAMSDPYNPFEKKYELTRKALELVDKYNFGISIATKSPLIVRDIDILKRIASHSPVLIKITITTADDKLCRKIEQGVAPTSERLKAIKALSDAGIYTGVLLMPVLPFINDTSENIKNVVRMSSEAGAKFVYGYGMGVTLRSNQRVHYYEKVNEIFKDRSIVKKYIAAYGNNYECPSGNYKELWKDFTTSCGENKVFYKMGDIISDYRRNYIEEQMSFF